MENRGPINRLARFPFIKHDSSERGFGSEEGQGMLSIRL